MQIAKAKIEAPLLFIKKTVTDKLQHKAQSKADQENEENITTISQSTEVPETLNMIV